jgi:uncharacterized protein
MDFELLISNLTNPTLLFFLLGIIAALVKSDLEVPEGSVRFIALYLLFAIGFKGGQELAHSPIGAEIALSLLFGIVLAAVIPLYSFFILKRKLRVSDAAAAAAAYGSVSAVTFVAATTFLESQQIAFGGHMVAVMALMESPAIIVGVVMMMKYAPASEFKDTDGQKPSLTHTLRHSFTNGSVLMLIGSLIIGYVADTRQAEGIRPFTTDIFKGFLAIFLLEMGMVTAKRFSAFVKYGGFVTAFAILAPLVNGVLAAILSGLITDSEGNRFMFAILAASASYIAVPAAMRIAAPSADPGLYIPMALGVTFPFNITLGMPVYFFAVRNIQF